jgi:hypothetical protein
VVTLNLLVSLGLNSAEPVLPTVDGLSPGCCPGRLLTLAASPKRAIEFEMLSIEVPAEVTAKLDAFTTALAGMRDRGLSR